MVVEISRSSVDSSSDLNVSSGGTDNGVASGRRAGRKPPIALRRPSMYCSSGLSCAGRENGKRAISSSDTAMLKRSRKARRSSSDNFFCWCVTIWPSPALPIPNPFTVLARITVGWPRCALAAA